MAGDIYPFVEEPEEASAEVPAGAPVAPRRRLRRRAVIPVAAAIGVTMILLLPLLLNLGWAPVIHWACQPGGLLVSETLYTPGVVGSSPYGGRVWANGSFPWNPTPIAGAGGNESNGGSFADLSTALFSVYPARNGTAWGPGQNVECTSPFLVAIGSSKAIGVKLLGLLPQGTRSDANASLQMPAVDANDSPSVILGDRYVGENSALIDTCHSSQSVERNVSLTSITVGIPVRLPDGNRTIPVTLDVSATFHYWFPASYGVWLVDNLSANAWLPGAGWAFDFFGCS